MGNWRKYGNYTTSGLCTLWRGPTHGDGVIMMTGAICMYDGIIRMTEVGCIEDGITLRKMTEVTWWTDAHANPKKEGSPAQCARQPL